MPTKVNNRFSLTTRITSEDMDEGPRRTSQRPGSGGELSGWKVDAQEQRGPSHLQSACYTDRIVKTLTLRPFQL